MVASFAEYLAEDVDGNPDRALNAMASLAEWYEGDAEMLAEARAAVRQDTRKVARRAQVVVAQNRDAIELLELVAHGS